MKVKSRFLISIFFSKVYICLGILTTYSRLNAESTSGHNTQKTTSSNAWETNQISLSHPIQNEALKKLSALSPCTTSEKALSAEAMSSKIRDALKSSVGKFFESQHIDILAPKKEKPLPTSDLKEILKNEKLASYFSKVFSKLNEKEIVDYYFKKNIGRSQKSSPEDLLDTLHEKFPELTKTLQEAAQELIKKTSTSVACKEIPSTLDGKIKEIENNLEEARKELNNTPVAQNSDLTKKIELLREELQYLKKIRESSQKLFDQINKETPISGDLLKETQLTKKDMTLENIADLKIKHDRLAKKEETFKKAETNYNLANLKYKDAVKKAPDINIEQTEVHQKLNEARKVFEESKKELEVAQKAEKNLNKIEKYAYLLESIENDFKSIAEDPGSKNGQEVLKYLKKKSTFLFQEDKLRMGTAEEIRDVKRALLKKHTEKGLIQRCIDGVCSFFNG
jgi:hypothetical protein